MDDGAESVLRIGLRPPEFGLSGEESYPREKDQHTSQEKHPEVENARLGDITGHEHGGNRQLGRTTIPNLVHFIFPFVYAMSVMTVW
jgi:hypothetical protein